jgi:hypothetical protein
MKELTPIQAAFLYHIIFAFEEGGSHQHEPVVNEAKAILGNFNYPSEVLFDNEGDPMVDWAQFGGQSPDHYNSENWLYHNEGDEVAFKPEYDHAAQFLFYYPTPENLGFIVPQIKELP